MITDANGKPISSGRSITIGEIVQDGKPTFAVTFEPSAEAFEFEEIIMILGDVTRALAQNARAALHLARTKVKVQQELNKLQGEK